MIERSLKYRRLGADSENRSRSTLQPKPVHLTNNEEEYVAANEAELSGLMRAGPSSFALVSALLKVAVTVVVLIPASIYLIRLARPGGERRTPAVFVAAPFIAVIVLAALSVTFAPRYHWSGAFSDEWLECVISIPLIAVLPFAVIIWVVRQMAPTDLARTGAFVGLLAGCVSAIGYAVHCADDSVPFFALWYGGTIALCTFAGWKLGPKLLRW